MAKAEKIASFSGDPGLLMAVIEDFEKYPEFVSGVHFAKVLEKTPELVVVEYGLELIGKKVSYTLEHRRLGASELRWKLRQSPMLSKNEGRWVLKEKGKNQTEVLYELEIDFTIPVPQFVLGGLVKTSLPAMMDSFFRRAKAVR